METPIIILHGWGASSKSFNKVRELLAQKGHSVFVLDLPGFGEAKPPQEAWSIDDYANHVIKYLRAQNLDKYILYGHSFGGRIAIKIAARFVSPADRQPKLAGLILCDAAGVTPRPKIKIAIFSFLSQIGKIVFSSPILSSLREFVRKVEYWLAGSKDYYYLQSSIMKEIFKKVIEEDLTSCLEKIETPTQIIWGERDRITPVSDAVLMHERIANSKLDVLEGVGHSPHLESPEKVVDLLLPFLRNVGMSNEICFKSETRNPKAETI